MGRLKVVEDQLRKAREGHYRHRPLWRGQILVKYPADMVLYAMAIERNKPDVIIETGTAFGGSALFFADMQTLFVRDGLVVTVDVEAVMIPIHKRVEYIQGSSLDPAVIEQVRARTAGKKVMVVLDSSHRCKHVAAEIEAYSPMVTQGQFLVVEDIWRLRGKEQVIFWPAQAVVDFLNKTTQFVRETSWEQRFGITAGSTREGWLRRV